MKVNLKWDERWCPALDGYCIGAECICYEDTGYGSSFDCHRWGITIPTKLESANHTTGWETDSSE